jgi:hypothetical protein
VPYVMFLVMPLFALYLQIPDARSAVMAQYAVCDRTNNAFAFSCSACAACHHSTGSI